MIFLGALVCVSIGFVIGWVLRGMFVSEEVENK